MSALQWTFPCNPFAHLLNTVWGYQEKYSLPHNPVGKWLCPNQHELMLLNITNFVIAYEQASLYPSTITTSDKIQQVRGQCDRFVAQRIHISPKPRSVSGGAINVRSCSGKSCCCNIACGDVWGPETGRGQIWVKMLWCERLGNIKDIVVHGE